MDYDHVLSILTTATPIALAVTLESRGKER